MKYLSPYRVATYLLVILFAGHTGGAMLSQQSMGAASDTVFSAMKTVHFALNGVDVTWYGFWFGFGLVVSAFILLSAIMAWQLDKVTPQNWPAVKVIAWALVLSQACNAILSWKYFFWVPGVLATLSTVLLAIGAWQKGKP